MTTETTQVEFRIFPGPIAHDSKTALEWRVLAKLMRFVSTGTVVDLDAPWVGTAGRADTTDAKNLEFILKAHALVLGPVRGKEDKCAFLCGIAAARQIPVFCFDSPYDSSPSSREGIPPWLLHVTPRGHANYGSKEAALLGCLEYLRGQRSQSGSPSVFPPSPFESF